MKKNHELPIDVPRGQTQEGVNQKVISYLFENFPKDIKLKALDLPCGTLEFLTCVKQLFPDAELTGADIFAPEKKAGINFRQMDLTEDFTIPEDQKFDLVTTISGVMMFSNTLRFVKNAADKLLPGGTFILTNDNNATIKDRLAYFFLGRYRIFNLVFEDNQVMTENVPVNELVRLIRTHGIRIDDIEYTSFSLKDLVFAPFALVAYLSQWLYLKRLNTQLPQKLISEMYPFKQLLCKHYIIRGTKI
ncbi:MAG: methyltransferase domain-containing protein [Sphingobacteriaceae bacterium]|nr:MAG: methyltransferase domain-containing protein [Sphingobacteriaceae bacterium]